MTRELPPLWPVRGRVTRQVLQIAHRGGNGGTEDYQPANLHRIAALGTHLVEIDVRTTADGHLVLHHDPEVVVDGQSIVIAACPAEELTALAPGRVHAAASVIRTARQAGLGVYADIKEVPEPGVDRLIELLSAEEMLGRVILASAEAETVARCAAYGPDVPRAVLFRSTDTHPIELAQAARADFLHPCWEAESRPDKLLAGPWLAEVSKHRLGVICWHEERPDVLAELLGLGVDGICTDDPALLAGLASAGTCGPRS